MTQLLLTHGTEEKKFIKAFMQYIPLSQHLFFLIKRKAVLKIHELEVTIRVDECSKWNEFACVRPLC